MVSEQQLKEFPVFRHLPQPVLAHLARAVTQETYKEGDVVFEEGKAGDAIYFVSQGEVLIQKTADAAKGAVKVIAVLGPGEFFGEMALLEDAPRSAAAVAHSPLTLLRLPRYDFEGLLKLNPKVAFEFFRGLVMTLSLRLRQTTREMVAIFEVGRMIAQSSEVRKMASLILSQLRNSFEGEVFGAFFYWNEFTMEYEPWATEGDCPDALRKNRTKTEPLIRWFAEKKECLLSADWSKDDRFPEKDRASWPGRSLLMAPILTGQGLSGLIVFGHAEPGFFYSEHRQVVAGVSNLVAASFENASWRQELEAKERLQKAKQSRY